MIKTLITLIFLIIFLVVTLPLILILKIMEYFKPSWSHWIAFRTVQWAFRVILFITGSKITYIGLDNISADQAYLIVANHKSYFDILATYVKLKTPTGFISKKEMQYVPILGWWITRICSLYLDRGDIKKGLKTILYAVERVKNGINIFIFPEGTRAHGDELLPFHGGSFKIAEKSGAPVLPIAICGTRDIFEAHFPWIKASHVIVEFGTPIETASLTPAERKLVPKQAEDAIRSMYEKNIKTLG